jgi:hypothetical protein
MHAHQIWHVLIVKGDKLEIVISHEQIRDRSNDASVVRSLNMLK